MIALEENEEVNMLKPLCPDQNAAWKQLVRAPIIAGAQIAMEILTMDFNRQDYGGRLKILKEVCASTGIQPGRIRTYVLRRLKANSKVLEQ